MAASLTSSRLPNLPCRSREHSRTATQTMTSSSSARHHHVDAEQPPVIALVQLAVVGGLRQQEHQHDADRRRSRAAATPMAQRKARERRAAGTTASGAGARIACSLRRSPAAAAGCASTDDVPVGLADRADLERPRQLRHVEPEAEVDVVARARGRCRRLPRSSSARCAAPRPAPLRGCRSSGPAPRPELPIGVGDTIRRQRRVSGW